MEKFHPLCQYEKDIITGVLHRDIYRDNDFAAICEELSIIFTILDIGQLTDILDARFAPIFDKKSASTKLSLEQQGWQTAIEQCSNDARKMLGEIYVQVHKKNEIYLRKYIEGHRNHSSLIRSQDAISAARLLSRLKNTG